MLATHYDLQYLSCPASAAAHRLSSGQGQRMDGWGWAERRVPGRLAPSLSSSTCFLPRFRATTRRRRCLAMYDPALI